ncbi:MAG: ScpA family protein [Patescibacteria group bacterium]
MFHSAKLNFNVKTTTFEGPLEILLGLIEKRKLMINEISLAQVADDFVTYIKQFGALPIGESAHFILIASTLLLIKSKSLLPVLNLTEDEQHDIADLERRLKIAQKIKEGSEHVKNLYGKQIMFAQQKGRTIEPTFVPHETMNTKNAYESMLRIIMTLPKPEKIATSTIKKVISLEEAISNLADRVSRNLRISFREFTGQGTKEKVNVIVSFLAMLELVKQGALQVSQEGAFDDIHIETSQIKVPRYN